jgi:hypothetical protein
MIFPVDALRDSIAAAPKERRGGVLVKAMRDMAGSEL